ncbi:prolyl-tRNA editing enzyme YbaK/EbsC (Cys-tRNA(Pro) deacylase) [Paenibacillus forsythiae]|uniref:Prolyl-tRNA editing enzyme YbaK/EbsC (Cys-tRNA(Pro) deacylase) n=1 Tax=Paenibacillus forsythiae TaxID=365616 RepID=A0ABU3H4I0_9BACL|nr:YbaK/EbsC family protein [Paenibacillus forsythiae]MDT3425723.1 prolyl-tRNA editing enzyme YbaK/EbsC (Cys-tRNA(Pro) deacylase) [Paenibacillus forsythiae]
MDQMEQLEHVLREKGIGYEIIQHEGPIKTAQEGAAFLGIEIGQTAPALVLRAGDEYFALIASGDRGRVNLEETAALLGRDSLKMASPKQVLQLTGYEVGSVSLMLPLPCIVDRRLFRHPFIYGGTGEPGSTLKISPKALEQLNEVVAYLD